MKTQTIRVHNDLKALINFWYERAKELDYNFSRVTITQLMAKILEREDIERHIGGFKFKI